MKRISIKRVVAVSLLLSGLANAEESGKDSWQFVVRPYLWAPTINGTLNMQPDGGGGAPSTEMGPSDYLSHMNAGLMLSGEARKGDWAIISDLIYLNMGFKNSKVKSINIPGGQNQTLAGSIDTGTETTLAGLEWMLAASKKVHEANGNRTEILGGVRYLGLEATVDWRLNAGVSFPQFPGVPTFSQSGSVSRRANLWDGIVGVRGRQRIGESNWSVPYYADIGVGPNNWTWQAMTGISYKFGWGEATLAYRHVTYDQSGERMVQGLKFSGPALGASFSF